MLVWALIRAVAHMQPEPLMGTVTLFLPAALCTCYALEKRRYHLSLDELTRRIELEGLAWAYSLGVLLWLWAGAVGYAVSPRWPLDRKVLSWMPFFVVAVILATIEGAYRHFAARRYQ